MYKINATSRLAFSKNSAIVVIRKPLVLIIICSCVSFILLMGLPYQIILFLESYSFSDLLALLIMVSFLSLMLYFICIREQTEIDVEHCNSIRTKSLPGVLLKRVTVSWDKDCYFKYELVYDSYKQVSEVWLIVLQADNTLPQRITRFYDEESFFTFRTLYNKHFPQQMIGEWYS